MTETNQACARPPVAAPAPDLPVAPDGTRAQPCLEPPPVGLACIPGGPFIRGSDDGPANTRPRATVWLQTYYMDINEVTYGEYKDCQKAGKCGKAGPLYNDFSRARQPMVGMNWYDADTYCKAQGKHLSTEAQWEFAARGTDGRTYPWGEQPPDSTRAVYGRRGGFTQRLESCSAGQGPFGHFDLAGNVWEWTAIPFPRCGGGAGPDGSPVWRSRRHARRAGCPRPRSAAPARQLPPGAGGCAAPVVGPAAQSAAVYAS